MGVVGTMCVVDWVTCDFPAHPHMVTNAASIKTVFKEVWIFGLIILRPICLNGLKLNFYPPRIDDLGIQDLFGVKIFNRYAFAHPALAFGFSKGGDSEPV